MPWDEVYGGRAGAARSSLRDDFDLCPMELLSPCSGRARPRRPEGTCRAISSPPVPGRIEVDLPLQVIGSPKQRGAKVLVSGFEAQRPGKVVAQEFGPETGRRRGP